MPGFQVTAWMDAFAACVRAQDIDGARRLFSEDCHAFGTRVEEADTLDALAVDQWLPIWSTTHGFRFVEESVRTLAAGDGSLACVMSRWCSEWTDTAGPPYPRHGRCTIVLRADPRSPCGAVAVHTHFSMSLAQASVERTEEVPTDEARDRVASIRRGA